MALAWNRLGVSSAVAHRLAYMDDGGTVMICTPLAMINMARPPSSLSTTPPLDHQRRPGLG